jgi:hypothetical protein
VYRHEHGAVAAVSGADPDTFTSLNGWFAKDAGQAYCCGAVIAGADPATFEIYVFSAYARDRHRVYRQHDGAAEVVAGADPASWQPPASDDIPF